MTTTEQTALEVPPQRGRNAPRVGVHDMPTHELQQLLRAHFIAPADDHDPGAVYLTEVTAPGRSGRRADAIHIGTWQSRGAGAIDVCELKTSRSDWLRELAQPAKAEAWWPYSSRWWLVVPHTGIARPDEMPPGWGLMVPQARGRRFKVLVKPEERKPELTTALLATLLTQTETTRKNALHRQAAELRERHQQELQKLKAERTQQVIDPATQDRLRRLKHLEEALGFRLDQWSGWGKAVDARQAGAALRDFVVDHAAQAKKRQWAERMARQAVEQAEQVLKAAKDLQSSFNAAPAGEEQ